jgi:hypothetical protein
MHLTREVQPQRALTPRGHIAALRRRQSGHQIQSANFSHDGTVRFYEFPRMQRGFFPTGSMRQRKVLNSDAAAAGNAA